MSLSPQALQGMEMGLRATFGGDPAAYIMPYLLGAIVDWILFGFVVNQFFVWLGSTEKERKFVTTCVVLAMVISVACSVYNVAWMFDIFVFNFGTYRTFIKNFWISTYGVLDTITILIVQTFYLDRAFRLNNRSILVLLITIPFMLLSAGGAVGTRVIYGESAHLNPMSSGDVRAKITSYSWVMGVLMADISITFFMSWGLWKAKTGWSQTNMILVRLMLLSLEAQIPALISAVLVAVTWFLHGQIPTTVGIFFEISHPKIYVVGLLAVLNSRLGLRQEMYSTKVQGTYQPGSGRGSQGNSRDPHTESPIPLHATYSSKHEKEGSIV